MVKKMADNQVKVKLKLNLDDFDGEVATVVFRSDTLSKMVIGFKYCVNDINGKVVGRQKVTARRLVDE